jgi:hypothetical protein
LEIPAKPEIIFIFVMLFSDDSDDEFGVNSADRELFAKYRVGERRVSTVYKVDAHVDNMGQPNNQKQQLTETLNR